MKKILILSVLACFVLLMLSTSTFSISWFEKEKEVPDEYLTKLFAPDFPYESIKVMEDSKARRFIVIRAKDKIEGKTLREYDDLLLSRGVSIYGTFHYGMFSWDKTVTDYAITITRKVEGDPDTVEISESVVKDPKKNEPIVAASAKGKEIRIAIEKDFGKTWKKIRIIPGKEPEAPEPKIGRYPGSKLRYAHNWPASQGGGRFLVYVSKDSLKNIYDYYEKKLKKGDPLAEEMFKNPRAFSRKSIKVFEIKTTGREFRINFYNQIPEKNIFEALKIFGMQSLGSNLTGFVQIEIRED